MYKHLFKRGKIGNVELKNRIFKAAAQNHSCPDGYVSERMIQFYEEEAKGGTGLFIIGLTRVSKYESPAPSGALGLENDDRIPGFGALIQAIHDNGAKACVQLAHFGSHAYPPVRCVSKEGLKNEFWLPEHFPELKKYEHEEYTIDEIEELVGFYGDAAVRAIKAGADMLEVHGGHRHGIGLFLSPLTNLRTDIYGGSLENRSRILFEVIENIQSKVGKDIPLIVRLNGTDGAPGGMEIEDAVYLAKRLELDGVAAINMSNQNAVVGMEESLGVHVWAAEAVKKHISIPVMSCGSINTPELAEEILKDGRADFIGTARALYADPAWPNKAKNGYEEDITPCIRCLECVGPRYNWKGPLVCSVNPRVGKEDRLPIERAENIKKVAVIGGGVAGMEAARVCSLRGHHVTIYEKKKMGGCLNAASAPDFKTDLRRLLKYYLAQIEKLNIHVVMEEATAEHLKEELFDAVIVATGGEKINLPLQGAAQKHVVNAIDILEDCPELGEQIVIIGGGTVGVETAVWLAEKGKKVTVLEMQDQVMGKENPMTRMGYIEKMRNLNVVIRTKVAVQDIQEGCVNIKNDADQDEQITADNVVMAAGLRPSLTFRDSLDEMYGLEVYAAGDCISPRKIFDAIHEGHICARQV